MKKIGPNTFRHPQFLCPNKHCIQRCLFFSVPQPDAYIAPRLLKARATCWCTRLVEDYQWRPCSCIFGKKNYDVDVLREKQIVACNMMKLYMDIRGVNTHSMILCFHTFSVFCSDNPRKVYDLHVDFSLCELDEINATKYAKMLRCDSIQLRAS